MANEPQGEPEPGEPNPPDTAAGDNPLSPLGVLRESIKAVPAMKYALAVAGVAAAASIAATFLGRGSPRTAVILFGVTLVAMFLLRAFAQLDASKSRRTGRAMFPCHPTSPDEGWPASN